MLRLAGLDAYPVLMMNGPRKDEEVPQPYFNHAITAVRLEEGSYVLMDATDENTKELLPAYLNDQSYLVARPPWRYTAHQPGGAGCKKHDANPFPWPV